MIVKMGLMYSVALRAVGLGLALMGGCLLMPVVSAAACPNEAVRTGPSANLPDCRAYEQVTPVDKGDSSDLFASTEAGAEGGIELIRDNGYASANGDSFLLSSPFTNFAQGASGENTYVFSRAAQGWTTTPVVPSGLAVQSVAPTVVDPSTNFAEVPFVDTVGSNALAESGGDESALQSVNLVGPPSGPYATLDSEQVSYASVEANDKIVGASADMSHVVLEGRNHQLARGDSGQDSESIALDEWVRAESDGCTSSSATYRESSGGCMELVNVEDDGSLVSECGAVLGESGTLITGGAYSAVSSDGSKVFFTAPDPYGKGSECWNPTTSPQTDPPQLYMRLDGTTTVDISGEPEAGVGDPTLYPAIFVGASANGKHVFFVTQTELTVDDTTNGLELYEYNTEPRAGEKKLIRISRGESGVSEGNVDFVAAISSEEGPEGIQVYFAAFGALAPGAQALNEEPNQEQVNLYRYATGTEKTHYIATIDAHEYPLTTEEQTSLWYVAVEGVPSHVRPESGQRSKELGLDPRANWYTTADGQYLVFASYQSLTGYDNATAPGSECSRLLPGESRPGSCAELYRYNAADNSIACVSCGPPGVEQVDDAEFARSALALNAPPPRPVSEDGNLIFFDSANALVPQARSGLLHVYEWHDGAISLISSVNDPGNAYFLGSSADGSDVFFGTHAQLVSHDTNSVGNLYDARVDGGFGAVTPPQCTGTGCQGVPAAPPIFATPSSVTFEGVGNFPPPPVAVKPKSKPVKCKRGSVKKHGRCIHKKAKKSAKGRK